MSFTAILDAPASYALSAVGKTIAAENTAVMGSTLPGLISLAPPHSDLASPTTVANMLAAANLWAATYELQNESVLERMLFKDLHVTSGVENDAIRSVAEAV